MLNFWNIKARQINQLKNKKFINFNGIDGTEYQRAISDYKGCTINAPDGIYPYKHKPGHGVTFDGIGSIEVDRGTAIKIRDFFIFLDSNK